MYTSSEGQVPHILGTAEQGQLLPALLKTASIDQEILEKLEIVFNCTFKGPSSHLKFIPLHPPLLDASAR